MKEKFKVQIFADGADIEQMKKEYADGIVNGFTTNPSLMKKAGVKSYTEFAKAAVLAIPDLSISFEVFADDLDTMEKEAKVLAAYGKNVFVKIPVSTTTGVSTAPLIKKLSEAGLSLNITAIFTLEQVREVIAAFAEGTHNYVSVFAGRIADSGRDPMAIMKEAAELCHAKPNTALLWASTREVYNIFEAEEAGADIITCSPDILAKIPGIGRDLNELSLDTIKMFNRDIKEVGFTIL